jgi:hypothetical protein
MKKIEPELYKKIMDEVLNEVRGNKITDTQDIIHIAMQVTSSHIMVAITGLDRIVQRYAALPESDARRMNLDLSSEIAALKKFIRSKGFDPEEAIPKG